MGKSRILEVDMKSGGERRWAKENIHVVTRPSFNAVGMGIWSPWMIPEREDMPGRAPPSFHDPVKPMVIVSPPLDAADML